MPSYQQDQQIDIPGGRGPDKTEALRRELADRHPQVAELLLELPSYIRLPQVIAHQGEINCIWVNGRERLEAMIDGNHCEWASTGGGKPGDSGHLNTHHGYDDLVSTIEQFYRVT